MTLQLKVWSVCLIAGVIAACNGTFEIGIERTPDPTMTDLPVATSTQPRPSPSSQPSATPPAPSTTPNPTPPPTSIPIVEPLSPTPTDCNPPANWLIYLVQPEDTLFNLSQDLNLTVPQLQLANCLETNTIRIGQPLYIPYVPTATASATATFTATPTSTATATPTPSPTLEATGTATPTPTGSATATASPTLLVTP